LGILTAETFIHPSADVEAGAVVGPGSKIWHLVHIRSSAQVGCGSVLGRNVYIDTGVRVGDRVKIQNNVSVYQGVTIEDDVFVGPCAVFTNDKRPRACNADWEITPTLVRRGASIGANATIVCGTTVGEYAMVAAGSVVTKDVAPFQLVAGNPARPIGWVDERGDVVSRGVVPPPRLGADPAEAATPAPIPVTAVVLGSEEEAAVLAVLRSGVLAQGPVVAELERRFAELHEAEHAVAVSNGTVALVAALKAMNVGRGHEVITTPFSFAATLNAILESGATVRFADVRDDYTIDPASVEALVTPATKVILPVHLYGLPADMPALSAIAERHGLQILEDAAQAVGARIGSRPIGNYGVATFSLYATKNIFTGEGGMITTPDGRIADRLRLLRNQGMRVRYHYEEPGHNWRMTDLQAAVGVPQMRRVGELITRRSANAERLSAGLADVPGLRLPSARDGRTHVWHQYTVRISDDAPVSRDDVTKTLEARGIGYGLYYPRLMHDYPCYDGHPRICRDDTPLARAAAAQVVSLPVHQHLSGTDLDRIVSAVREALHA